MTEDLKVGILILNDGNIQFTGADIPISAILDARDRMLEFVRGQVVRPQIPRPEPDGVPERQDEGEG
jgi:hypothetical protein